MSAPSAPTLVDAVSGEELAPAEVASLVSRLGADLERRAGPGERVAARLGCDLGSALLVLACLDRGLCLAPLHPRLTPVEASRALSRLAPSLSLGAASSVAEVRTLPQGSAPRAPPRDAPALIVSTSGSTAEPKGVVLSRGALASSCSASASNLPLSPTDRTLACLPLAHVGGLSILTRALASSSTVVLAPTFDPEALLEALERFAITRASLVPTMLARMLQARGASRLALPAAILVGGAACPAAVLEACDELGARTLTTYGLTEMASQVTTERPRAERSPRATKRGSGVPLAGAVVRVEGGRILVGGPMRMDGYDGGPGARPVAPFDERGLFDTGDLGVLDGGVLHVVGRAKELIVTGGENVSPAEVEEALLGSTRLLEVAVVGRPDPIWGERVVAFVVPRFTDFDPARDLATALATLATFKRPREVVVVPALPRLASGKVDRRALV